MAAIGQCFGAAVTIAAVVAALRIAARDRRMLEQHRFDEAVGLAAAMVFARDSSGEVVITNHGDRPHA